MLVFCFPTVGSLPGRSNADVFANATGGPEICADRAAPMRERICPAPHYRMKGKARPMKDSSVPRASLRTGDVVRVRSREEILATLDDGGRLDELPFMPEMLKFAGQELKIYARADKTCDTVEMTGTTRRMDQTVHLTDARCDGQAHGGCQAGCMLFWKEEWLERADTPGEPCAPPQRRADPPPTEETLHANTTQPDDGTPGVRYRCQATDLLRASSRMSPREWRQYVNDVRTGNVTTPVVLRGLAIEVFNKYQRFSVKRLPRVLRLRQGRPYPFYQGTGTGERTPTLNLQAGEIVEIKSKAEIMATLGPDNRNRKMWFDSEMLPYCGRRVKVLRQVQRIIDEPTGRMIKLADCVVLDQVECLGIYHRFCRRAITPYWREAWLRRPTTTDETASEHVSIPAGRA